MKIIYESIMIPKKLVIVEDGVFHKVIQDNIINPWAGSFSQRKINGLGFFILTYNMFPESHWTELSSIRKSTYNIACYIYETYLKLCHLQTDRDFPPKWCVKKY